jgi:hypothetical protein
MNSEKGLKWMLVAILVLVLIIGALNIGLFKLTEKFLQEANEPTEAPIAAVLPTAIPAPTKEEVEEAPQKSQVVVDNINPAPGGPGTSTVTVVFRSADVLAYPEIVPPNAARQIIFPDVPHEGRPALVAYESPFEDGDYCDNTPCGMDVPQYYYRVMTAGEVTIPDLGVSCIATPTKGCLVIVVNHFGPTAMYRGNTIDHGFTIAGRVWDMENPEDVSIAGQALLDHYVYRMSAVPDGANCSTIDACETVEWHMVVIGNGESQAHWSGLFRR